MLLRAPFNLQPFRALEDKRKLLHLAALSYDQNCVLSVVLFLRVRASPSAPPCALTYSHRIRSARSSSCRS